MVCSMHQATGRDVVGPHVKSSAAGEVRVRRDGRPLVTEHPVRPEEFIEINDGPIPDGVIVCGYRSSEPPYEAWMDDI